VCIFTLDNFLGLIGGGATAVAASELTDSCRAKNAFNWKPLWLIFLKFRERTEYAFSRA
jgi:hypothetical protein